MINYIDLAKPKRTIIWLQKLYLKKYVENKCFYMFAVVFRGMYIFITSPDFSFLTPFFFDNLSFSSNFRY